MFVCFPLLEFASSRLWAACINLGPTALKTFSLKVFLLFFSVCLLGSSHPYPGFNSRRFWLPSYLNTQIFLFILDVVSISLPLSFSSSVCSFILKIWVFSFFAQLFVISYIILSMKKRLQFEFWKTALPFHFPEFEYLNLVAIWIKNAFLISIRIKCPDFWD